MRPAGPKAVEPGTIGRHHPGAAIGSEPTEVSGAGTTFERLSVLANLLFVAAALIGVLAVITALTLASSRDTLGIFETFERQSRDLAALATLGAGATGAAVVAGIAGILKVLLLREMQSGRLQ